MRDHQQAARATTAGQAPAPERTRTLALLTRAPLALPALAVAVFGFTPASAPGSTRAITVNVRLPPARRA